MMMLVLAGVEVKGLNSIRDSLDEIVEGHYRRLQIVQDMRFLARHGGVIVRNMFLVPDESTRSKERHRFDEAERTYRILLEQLHDLIEDGEEDELLQKVVEAGEITYGLWKTIADSIGMPETSSDWVAIDILEEEVRSHQWGWLDGLQELVVLEQNLAEQSRAYARENYRKTKIVMAVINLLAVVIACMLVVAITASIAVPLSEIRKRVDLIARGDFTTRINISQKGEVGQLANHINRMVEKLQTNEEELNKYRYNLEELIEWRTGEVNEQRERFISVLIHDLKGPLIPIVGFSRLLMKKKHLTSEQISQYASAIHDSAGKLMFTVEQKSAELREKRLSYSFDRTPFDIEELLCAVCKGFQAGFVEKEIEIRINNLSPAEYQNAGNISFLGDIGKVRSIFENLIGNAGKYAEKRVDISIAQNGAAIELKVDDDGCGIPRAFHKKIFEEYYQAPGSRAGTGIGLYSVKRIVDYYRGDIEVSTSPIGGTRFSVTLPMVETDSVTSV